MRTLASEEVALIEQLLTLFTRKHVLKVVDVDELACFDWSQSSNLKLEAIARGTGVRSATVVKDRGLKVKTSAAVLHRPIWLVAVDSE